MAKFLSKNYSPLSSLPCDPIKFRLLTYKIISLQEKQQMDYFRNESRMFSVLSNIQSSLYQNQTEKFKKFLQLLEKSSENLLKETAKALG